MNEREQGIFREIGLMCCDEDLESTNKGTSFERVKQGKIESVQYCLLPRFVYGEEAILKQKPLLSSYTHTFTLCDLS